MATRAEIKRQLRAIVGLASDDPLASDDVLNPIVIAANAQIVAEIAETCPDALSGTATVTLTAGVGATPADTYQLRAVRETDRYGSPLTPAPFPELEDTSAAYALTGIGPAFVLTVTEDVVVAAVWIAYTKGAPAADLAADTDSPTLIPLAFHDVVALDAAYAMALGGEQRVPPEIAGRLMDRKGRMMAYLDRARGAGPSSRTRMVVGQGEWP